jgi:hypothetical protein
LLLKSDFLKVLILHPSDFQHSERVLAVCPSMAAFILLMLMRNPFMSMFVLISVRATCS